VPRPHAGHHRSVFTLLAWNPLYEQITLGVILLLAVGGDAWSRLRTT
jgi:ribose/xylose/arabinose/galactoside ABC-type transport system permease subunit